MEKKWCLKHKIQAVGKRDTGALQCPVADSRCLLLHINLGRQNTVPCGALKCSAQKKNVAFDACQSKPTAACRQLPRHGWATERKMGAVVSAPWHQPCSCLDALQAFNRWKLLWGRQFCKYAEAGFKRASSTDRNAPHKLAFPRVWVDFAAQNLFQRHFVMLFWLFCFLKPWWLKTSNF